MDNEHTTITGRQANPLRPQRINSLRINDRSALPLPSASGICAAARRTPQTGRSKSEARRSVWTALLSKHSVDTNTNVQTAHVRLFVSQARARARAPLNGVFHIKPISNPSSD